MKSIVMNRLRLQNDLKKVLISCGIPKGILSFDKFENCQNFSNGVLLKIFFKSLCYDRAKV
jgi:hypothetical protein